MPAEEDKTLIWIRHRAIDKKAESHGVKLQRDDNEKDDSGEGLNEEGTGRLEGRRRKKRTTIRYIIGVGAGVLSTPFLAARIIAA